MDIYDKIIKILILLCLLGIIIYMFMVYVVPDFTLIYHHEHYINTYNHSLNLSLPNV